MDERPVVVIGAGPARLAAPAHLVGRDLTPLALEAASAAGAAVRERHHVRLFSGPGELVDTAAEKLLAPTGWQAQSEPDVHLVGMKSHGSAPTFPSPTGDEQGESAERIELVLPETDICGGGLIDQAQDEPVVAFGGSCGPATPVGLSIGAPAGR